MCFATDDVPDLFVLFSARHMGHVDAGDTDERQDDGRCVVGVGIHEVVGEEETWVANAHLH